MLRCLLCTGWPTTGCYVLLTDTSTLQLYLALHFKCCWHCTSTAHCQSCQHSATAKQCLTS